MYKPGDKLVLEIKKEKIDKALGIKTYVVKDVLDAVFPEYILDEFDRLDSNYINEHFGELQDRAYAKGREDGFNDGKETGWFEGVNMAWDLARRLFLSACDGVEDALSDRDLNEIFETRDIAYIVNRYTPDEIKSKIEAWEKAKEEIKVGDVVKSNENELVITSIRGNDLYYCLNKYGQFVITYRQNLTKTGRTIDITSVLEQIGGTV